MKSAARLCSLPSEESLGPLFKSQSGEDRTLLQYFHGLCGGTYLEMGGLDGVRFSNSYVFNKGLGWRGLLVELGPDNYAELIKKRTTELATVNVGVCDKKRTIHYVERLAVGGIWEFMAEEFRQRWWPHLTINDTVAIECLPLQDIIKENLGETFYFDFFSLDVEGSEFEALTSLDFEKVGFGIILVEADAHNVRKNFAVRALLERNGYIFLEFSMRSYWFVNNKFDIIYKDLLHQEVKADSGAS